MIKTFEIDGKMSFIRKTMFYVSLRFGIICECTYIKSQLLSHIIIFYINIITPNFVRSIYYHLKEDIK